jgi:hypothetical protein
VGLGTAAQLIMPLHRRALLIMGDLDDELRFVRVPGTALIANTVNALTLRNARRAGFHHPDDRPFAGLKIPEPPTTEMSAGPGEVESLIEAFARQQGRSSGLPPV